ncbi:MAG: hypothetical protein Fur0046_25100 [Cyanobacteria bacterium J069]
MVLVIMLLGWLGMVQSAQAAPPTLERLPLTLELLQQRLKKPMLLEDGAAIDLRRVIIDLRPENVAFRDQFYRLVQAALQRSPTPLGLDFSNSLIQGKLDIAQIGLQAPVFGDELPDLLTEDELAQLRRDRRRITQLSQLSRSLLTQEPPPVLKLTVLRGPLLLAQTRIEGVADFSNTFFLSKVDTAGTDFTQEADWSDARFSRPASFADALFRQEARFRSVIFFERAAFGRSRFQATANFQSSEFQAAANFNRATFQQVANFSRVRWQGNADFAQTRWEAAVVFNQSQFGQSLFLSDAVFDQAVTFREVQFARPVNLRGAVIQAQTDFGDASFAPGAYLNVAGLQFNPDRAKILGSPGQIGRAISVPTLQGNETILRNLVRNFRSLEQIADANQIGYLAQRLRSRQIERSLWGVNLNTDSQAQLQQVGFSAKQAGAIALSRAQHSFSSLSDLLKLDDIDLATYVKVRDRVIASTPRSLFGWLSAALNWVWLALLLTLTRYGTSSGLAFGVGLIAVAYFALVFWLVDRARRLHPQPILPTPSEAVWMLSSTGLLTTIGLSTVFRLAESPWLTLACLGIVTIPVPATLLFLLYRGGRFHDQMDVSYFVEEGTLRQLRILIGRLPTIPRYEPFRERYAPLLWDRRWNWLNYLDLSANNLLRFGFNDIRLRDEHLPGLITTLVWYQWGFGLVYTALLLWTLSRTIPGLNLLIYFK